MTSSAASPGRLWGLACADMAGRTWDGDSVLLNPLSGHTHVLDLVSSHVLQAVATQPRTRDELCVLVARLLDIDDRDLVASHVDAIVDQFDEAGLIESRDP